MKPVDAVAFKKIKATREGNNNERDNFEIEIIDEGALDKALAVPEQTLDRTLLWKTIYDVINDE